MNNRAQIHTHHGHATVTRAAPILAKIMILSKAIAQAERTLLLARAKEAELRTELREALGVAQLETDDAHV